MLRFPITILVCAAPLLAQFSNLAATHDGSQVFFVTPLRQRGTEQFPHAKLFAWSESGIQLLFQRVLDSPPGVSAFMIFPTEVSVAGDGSVVAFSAGSACVGGSSCQTREQYLGIVSERHTGAEINPGPHVRVSRNGRYVLWWASSSAFGPSPRSGILDRAIGQRRDLRLTQPACGDIASNGVAVLNQGGVMAVVRPDGTETLFPATGIVLCPKIDDSATVAMFTRQGQQLVAIRVADGLLTSLTPEGVAASSASISADGLSVFYVAPAEGTSQLFSVTIDGASRKQLTNAPEGVSEAAISGDGRVAWVATMDGRLLKLDLATGAAREVLAPPMIQSIGGTVVPGSLMRITGRRLGNRVRFEDLAGAVVSTRPEEILAQVPWELPMPLPRFSAVSVRISADRDDSPFESVTPEWANSYQTFRPTGFVPPIHEDWSGFVTEQSPARPGEVLHIFATGLGPVDCQLRTGEAAPLDRLCRTTQPVQWDYWWTSTDSMPAEILFSGLAPGLVGLYQIEARLPANPPADRLKLIAGRFGWNVAADFVVSAASLPEARSSGPAAQLAAPAGSSPPTRLRPAARSPRPE